MEKVPYTKNTRELRVQLEYLGYLPLKFFQGGVFVRPMITTWANSKEEWKQYEYSTFNDVNKQNFESIYLTQEKFLQELTNLKNHGKRICKL